MESEIHQAVESNCVDLRRAGNRVGIEQAVPNHPQFAEAVGDLLNANFASITQTSLSNRTVQLGLHFYF